MPSAPPFIPPTFDPPSAPLGIVRFLPRLLRNPLETMPAQVFSQPAFKVKVFGQEILFLTHPDAIKAVLQNADGAYPKGELGRHILGAALGDGLFTSSGPKWRWQRRTVAPAFQAKKIAALVPRMDAIAATTARRLRAAPADRPLDIARTMRETTFDIIADTMLAGPTGRAVNFAEEAIEDYIRAVPWRFAAMLLGLSPRAWHPGKVRMERAARTLREDILALIRARRNASARGDLIDLLLKASHPDSGEGMDDGALVDNIMTFLAAGHETTAQALSWCLYLIAAHPPTAEAVRAEIDETFTGDQITVEDLDKLVFTHQVLKEAMRLYPPAPIIFREATRPVEWFGRSVEAGAFIEIPIYALHRHRDYWANPDVFEPARFTPEQEKVRPRYTYIPFGDGPRVCIGATFANLEAKVVLAHVLRAVHMRLDPTHAVWPEARLTLRPRGGLPMYLSARRHKTIS